MIHAGAAISTPPGGGGGGGGGGGATVTIAPVSSGGLSTPLSVTVTTTNAAKYRWRWDLGAWTTVNATSGTQSVGLSANSHEFDADALNSSNNVLASANQFYST